MPAYIENMMDDVMNCYDVDGDGFLSQEEVDAYVVHSFSGGRCPGALP